MIRQNLRKIALAISVIVLGAVSIGVVGATSPDGGYWNPGNGKAGVDTLTFDVAEDMTRFAFDPDLTFEEDGMPAHGSSFVTQGYLYPEGTLEGTNGVNPDGSPEFPDKVIGSWTCYGTLIGEGAHTTSGAWVVSTQIYSFGDETGRNTIVTDGYELADIGVEVKRAITGGTDDYANARGEGRQELLGFNASGGVSISVELDVKMR